MFVEGRGPRDRSKDHASKGAEQRRSTVELCLAKLLDLIHRGSPHCSRSEVFPLFPPQTFQVAEVRLSSISSVQVKAMSAIRISTNREVYDLAPHLRFRARMHGHKITKKRVVRFRKPHVLG